MTAEAGGISQPFCRSGWDWSNFLQESITLIRISLGVSGITQTFCWSIWNWSNFLQECLGLVKPSVGISGIGQTFCGSELNFCWSREGWSKKMFVGCLWELVKHSAGVGGIRQTGAGGSVSPSAGPCGIGQSLGKSRISFFQTFSWSGWVGQILCGCGQDWPNPL